MSWTLLCLATSRCGGQLLSAEGTAIAASVGWPPLETCGRGPERKSLYTSYPFVFGMFTVVDHGSEVL